MSDIEMQLVGKGMLAQPYPPREGVEREATLLVSVYSTNYVELAKDDTDAVSEAMGLIPDFLFSALARGIPDNMASALCDQYQSGLCALQGTIDDDGIYDSLDGDPRLPPHIVYTVSEDIQIYQYPYDIIAIKQKDNLVLTRMD